MLLKDFIKILQNISDGCSSAHNIPQDITFYDDTNDRYLKIKEIEADRLPGCGCWVGACIELVEDES